MVPPLWMNSLPGALHLLEDEALAAEEAGADPLGEGNAQVDVADGAEERVLLAEQLAGVQIDLDDLAGIRSGNATRARACGLRK